MVGGFLLAAGLVVIFGAGEYFKKKDRFVLYFEDSVKGLDVGAPVCFFGVKVGLVTKVEIVFDSRNFTFCTPVYVEVDTERVRLMEYGAEVEQELASMTEKEFRNELVARGLRAQLKVDSLLTGKLYVDVGMYPDRAFHVAGKSKTLYELPTVLSDISELSRTMDSVSFQSILEGVASTVESVDSLTSSLAESHLIQDVSEAVVEFKGLVAQTRKTVDPLAESIQETARDTRRLVVNSDAGMQKTFGILEEVGTSSRDMMGKAGKTLDSIELSLGKDSAMIYRINRMLSEVSETARSMRILVDYLERHPDALVFGKAQGE